MLSKARMDDANYDSGDAVPCYTVHTASDTDQLPAGFRHPRYIPKKTNRVLLANPPHNFSPMLLSCATYNEKV